MLATLNGPTDTYTLRNLTNVVSRTAVNRTLAYVQVDGQDYSVLSVAAGAGRAYVFDRDNPPARAGDIAAAEAAARASSQGLWGAPCFGHTG